MAKNSPGIEMEPRVGFFSRAARALFLFARARAFTLVPFLILLAALGYYYFQYRQLSGVENGAAAQAQIQEAVTAIEKIMYVSDSSGAQLATITDKSKLKGQKFFEHAENGDELVLFPAAKKAVLYRPSTKKIVEIGPFTPDSSASVNSNSFDRESATPAQ